VKHTKTRYVKPFAPAAFQQLSTLLRLHPPQTGTSLLLALRVFRLCRFDFHCRSASHVPLLRLSTVPAAYMPNDCTERNSGILCTLPLPIRCSVIVVFVSSFDTSSAVHLRSAPVNLPERLMPSLSPCPLNTSRVRREAPQGGLVPAPVSRYR